METESPEQGHDVESGPYSQSACQTNLNPDNESSVAILVDAHLGQYDAVRRPASQPSTDNSRTERNLGRPNLVRGSLVAVDTLIDALTRYASSHRRELFVYPEARAALLARFKHLELNDQRQNRIRINSVTDITRGIDRYRIEVWFNPMPNCKAHGGVEMSYGVRNYLSSRPFPITTLMHGLSGQDLVHSVYLEFLLQPTLACDSIICTSRAARDSTRKIIEYLTERFNKQFGAQAKYKGRFDLIPLCVDTSELQPRDKIASRLMFTLPQDSFIVIYLGVMSPMKGDLYPFLHAFCELVRKNPDRKLMWILAGTESPNYTYHLLTRARELGIAECIKCFLDISDADKSLLLPAADVFVSPVDSLDESFGLAPVEAMSCGVPQVVPDWNGYRDTVAPRETGFLTPTYWASCSEDLNGRGNLGDGLFNRFCLGQSTAVDMVNTVHCLQILIDNNELRSEMGRRSRQRAVALYSYNHVAAKYEQLWEELANEARRIQSWTGTANFDALNYHQLFGHYSSITLNDDSWLQLTGLGEAMATASSFPSEMLPALRFKVLDANVLRRALIIVLSHPNSGRNDAGAVGCPPRGRVQIDELVRTLKVEYAYNSDHLRRHVMWLIKYSYLRPVSTLMNALESPDSTPQIGSTKPCTP